MKSQTKSKLSQAFTILKGDIFLNSSILLIESIIFAVLLFIIFSTCFSATTTNAINSANTLIDSVTTSVDIPNASTIFVNVFTSAITGIGSIFTYIFMAKSLSYLHNKRKLDMFGSMPISRKAFFNSKLLAAYIKSTAIVTFFYIVALIIGLCTGATVAGSVVTNILLYLFSNLFTICLYGLCAVCSKSTLGSVVSYFIITMAVPTVVGLVKAFISGFFIGVNSYLFDHNFVENIFSPDRNTSLLYIIGWVLLSAGCVLLADSFVKKRMPENTGKKLYVPILEYIIKVSLTIIIGTFFGLLHGVIYTNNGTFGFIISFLIVGIATYVIIHVIYNNGEFKKLLSNSIVLGVVLATCIGGFLLCDANPMGYNNTVPTAESIASAGYLRTNNISKDMNSQLVFESMDDFKEDEDIKKILTIHNELASNQPEYTTAEKLQNVVSAYFFNLFTDGRVNNNIIVISYKYKNGMIGSYKYDGDLYYNHTAWYIYDTKNTDVLDAMAETEYTDTYATNYRSLFTVDPADILDIEVLGNSRTNIITFYERYTLGETGNASEDILYHKLRKDLSTAFKKDFENDKNREENCKPFFEYTSYGISSDTLSDKLILTFKCDSENTFSINSDDTYYVPKTYTETIKVLKDYNILNDDFTVNRYY